MLPEREPECAAAAEERKKRATSCQVEVVVSVFDVGVNDLEDGAGEGLPDVEEREGREVVVEFEAKHLTRVRVERAVLEAPHEAHDPGERIELKQVDEAKGHSAHRQDDQDVHDDSKLAAELVNEEADEEAAEDLSGTKENHGKHGPFELVLFISAANGLLKHLDKVVREVGDATASPQGLGYDAHESLVETQAPELQETLLEAGLLGLDICRTLDMRAHVRLLGLNDLSLVKVTMVDYWLL